MKGFVIILGILIVFLTAVLIYVAVDEESRISGINANMQENKSADEAGVGDSCIALGCSAYTGYVGSVNSDKYHSCSSRFAQQIHAENLVCFRNENEAILRGYVKGDVE